MDVREASSALWRSGPASHAKRAPNVRSLLSRTIELATSPGWRLFDVTPVAVSRRASSFAKRTFASLLRA
jgi:hypothetical protein